MLQQLHNLSDDKIEYQIWGRFSFMRFLGLQLEGRVPDAKTVWLFRGRLKGLIMIDVLFAGFHHATGRKGLYRHMRQLNPYLTPLPSPKFSQKQVESLM